MSCGVGRRHGLDPTLLWLWHRLAAPAPIRSLAWEPTYAVGAAKKKTKEKKKRQKIKKLKRRQQKYALKVVDFLIRVNFNVHLNPINTINYTFFC